MAKKFFIKTYGCQMNVHDSEYMAALLKGVGYIPTTSKEEADIILLNTCTVRKKPEQKAYSFLGRLKYQKRHRPLIIGVGGCLAQQQGELLLKRMPHIDFVFGTHQIYRLPEIIRKLNKNKKGKICETNFSYQLEPPKGVIPTFNKFRAYITIMQGCNNFCTYCIVPYVRGREISRRSESILEEAKRLLDMGVKEIILLGQNVNSYGKDRKEEISFAELIRKVGNLPKLRRLRFLTSHPKDLTLDLIKTFKEVETLCEQIHLPVQCGSNRILKKMNRRYSREDYLKKIEMLRKVCPEIAITTDIIVGFPGETEKDFKQTISLLQEVSFDDIFAFKYSDRPPAKAVGFKEKVSEEIKAERLAAVHEVQAPITKAKNREKVGQRLEVLLDDYSKRGEMGLSGRTRCNRVVNVRAEASLLGHLVEVEIDEALSHSLRGRIIKVLD